MTRILITGSEGALGFYLKRALVERNIVSNSEVFCLSRSSQQLCGDTGFRPIQADFLNERDMGAVLRATDPDLVYHLAWETRHGSYWDDEINRPRDRSKRPSNKR